MLSSSLRMLAVLSLGFAALVSAGVVTAGDDDVVKSAFILNLAKYVDWPTTSFAGDDAAFVIGVIEDAGFASALAGHLEGKRVDGRALEVRTVATIDDARECHLLYGPRKQRQKARQLALDMRGEPVLSVAEYDRFAHVGGMVAVDARRGKISFEISRSAADRGGLKVSSKLLRLASAVR